MKNQWNKIYKQIKNKQISYADAIKQIKKIQTENIQPSANNNDISEYLSRYSEVYVYNEMYLKDHLVNEIGRASCRERV